MSESWIIQNLEGAIDVWNGRLAEIWQLISMNPATFKGGLSANFGGTAWQDAPNLRDDIITVYTPEFTEDTFVKGKIHAKLKVKTEYNWTKIAQDTHFAYEKAIAETMASRQAKQIAQEEAQKEIKKANEITNLLSFKKSRQAFA